MIYTTLAMLPCSASMADDLIVVPPRSPGFAEGQLCKDGHLACENAEITL